MEDAIWALSPYKNITHKMLNASPDNRDLRKYVVEKVKAPLMYFIQKYAKGKRPKELSHNGQILAQIGEKFLELEAGGRTPLFSAGIDLFLNQYENTEVRIPRGIEIFASRYPEPTLVNTDMDNTHLLIQIEREFFEKYPQLDTHPMRMVFRVFICEYHHDIHYYGVRMDWWLQQIALHILVLKDWEDRDSWMDWLIRRLVDYAQQGAWCPRMPHQPHYCWKEVSNDWWGGGKLKEVMRPYSGKVYA